MTTQTDPIPYADITITMPTTPFVSTNGMVDPATARNTINATLAFSTPSAYASFFAGSTGQLIIVTPPPGYTGQVQLNYKLASTAFTLLGLAFEPAAGDVGQREFRTVALNRNDLGSVMTVSDMLVPSDASVTFTYGILVQDVATGAIGLIDPQIHDKP